jgi:molybdate transport system substrate-binding protein
VALPILARAAADSTRFFTTLSSLLVEWPKAFAAARTPFSAVPAAGDLKFAMGDVASQYEKQTGSKVNVTFGSSGNFFSQLQNGAPFDLFFSADVDYARRLDKAGLAEPGTLYPYAIGRIVVWAPADSKVDVTKLDWKALLSESVQKIAIANPEHAPYGRAAVAAMQKPESTIR